MMPVSLACPGLARSTAPNRCALSLVPTSFALALLATSAGANEISYSASVTNLAPNSTGSVTVPKFDPALGVLRAITFRIQVSTSGSLQLENTNAAPVTIWSFLTPGWVVAMGCTATPYPPSPGGVGGTAIHYLPTTDLQAYNNITNFSEPSSHTLVYSNQGGGSTSAWGQSTFSSESTLQPYLGPGTATIPVLSGSDAGPVAPAGVVVSASGTASATVTVTYDFDPMPAAICWTTVDSGCPCNNAGQNAGCGNSVNPSGGLLSVTGDADLSADTLVLAGSGMTNSSALYAQGTSYSITQTPFGDGLRCIGGSIRRLGIRANAAGVSQYPGPGLASVSVQGAVTAPGTRYYQVHYRDVGAYCTPATFNMTSGVAILWHL